MPNSKELTRAEEQIMQILWELEKGFVKDLIEKMPEPKPAYNTVSTIIRILEKKGFVGHKSYGNTHQYHPIVSKAAYRKAFMKNVMKNYFGNSAQQLVSFFASGKNVSLKELEEIREIMNQEINKKKNN
jgi:BlaI family transcriptional regulator, penicillinase repressor